MRVAAAFAFLLLAQGVLAQSAPLRVIVALHEPDVAAAGALRQEAMLRRASSIAEAQERVLGRVGTEDVRVYARWSLIPAFAAEVSESALERLRNDPDVRAVGPDVGGSANLAQSVPLIHGDAVRALGFVGSGVTVAVLDSGTLRTHADLQGAVVDEACFCTNANGTGCCPNGSTSQTGTGAANDGNGHGTNVAGIIASRGIVSSPGVAPGCSLVSVRVLDAAGNFNAASQVISGLNYVLSSHPEVRAVNMSLGTGVRFAGACDNQEAFTMAFASAINALKTNGTAVFASAGNNFSSSTMGAPACVQNTIAVGAVYDAAFGTSALFCSESTAADKITCFSNASTVLDLLAPGAAITSDGSGGGLSTYYGTSQASPHAAGAAAVLFAANPSLTPSQVESALESTGVSIFDSRIGLSYPRIDLQAAFNSVGACTLSVAFPRQHDALFYGNSYNIAWSKTATCGGNVKIELYKGGVLHSTITASAPSNGSYAWVPPNALPSAADYRIRITDLSSGVSAFGEDGFIVTGAPSPFVAGGAPSQVFLAWSSPGIIGQYRVLRRDATTTGFVLIGTTPNTNYTDSTVQPDRGYLYLVQRVDAYGNLATSNAEAATTFAFTDEPVAAGSVVKRVHVTELRAAVDGLRAAAGLGPFSYTDDGSLVVRAVHIMQLRAALDDVRLAASLPALGYGETVASGSIVKATHINELRPGVQ